MQHAARSELLPELRVLRIVDVLRLLLGVEMVEVAEELVESVHGGQELVAVAEMVLAELAGRIPCALSAVAIVGSSAVVQRAPGIPTLVRPVR
jgi:hypothetical protein